MTNEQRLRDTYKVIVENILEMLRIEYKINLGKLPKNGVNDLVEALVAVSRGG